MGTFIIPFLFLYIPSGIVSWSMFNISWSSPAAGILNIFDVSAGIKSPSTCHGGQEAMIGCIKMSTKAKSRVVFFDDCR